MAHRLLCLHVMRAAIVIVACAACSGPISDDETVTFAEDHPRIYMTANRARLAKALTARTPAAARFKDVVDRWVAGEDIYAFPAWHAALLGQLDGNPKYCTAAVAAIERQVAAAESRIADGEIPFVAEDSYLEVGELIGDLALVYDWCFDAVAERRATWLAYAHQAVWNVWNHEQAAWGGNAMPWTGWAIDDPSNNYYYSFLRATMLLGLAAHGERPGIDEWLAQFRDVKLGGELLPTFDRELVGGGSREGTGYGIAMRGLFELYDFWQASTGENIAAKTKHTRASLLAMMHATLPTLDRVAPTGDQSRDSTAALFDYHRAYLQELVALHPTDAHAGQARALLDASTVPEMRHAFMYAYDFLYDADVTPTPLADLNTVYHAAGTGQLYMRSGWDSDATWVNLIAGPYTQSHAHQDQGALMIFKNGWLSYDAVVDSSSGLRQEVGAHSTMRIIDGGSPLEQQTGTEARLVALHRGDGYVHAAADLAPVYDGAVQRLQRELVYLEPDCVVVYDRVTTGSGSEQVWQLATPTPAVLSGNRARVANDSHALSIERMAPAAATSSVAVLADEDGDFNGGFRLEQTIAGGDRRWLHVLWVDSATTSRIMIDERTVQITLADGRLARVQFSRDNVGATLVLAGATIQLGAGVDVMPE